MGLIDFILNLAGLLLWLNWRSMRFDPLLKSSPATLVGTLRPAAPRRLRGWQLLAGLALLLVVRAVLYMYLGSAVDWQPRLDLGVIILRMRSDTFPSAFAFSLLSFSRVLLILFFWLLVIAALNRANPDPDPFLKLLRMHLGRASRWPWPLQLAIPVILAALLWASAHSLLVRLGTLDPVASLPHLLEQGLLIGVSLIFTLKYLLPLVLFLYVLTSYVYLGSNPCWDFISNTARNLVAPLHWLRFGKVDFAPIAGMILIFLALHGLPTLILEHLAKRKISIWPL